VVPEVAVVVEWTEKRQDFKDIYERSLEEV